MPATPTTLDRRRFLAAAGVLAAPLALAGCGFVPQGSAPKSVKGTLTFTLWGTDAELAGFKTLVAGFEKANSGAKVTLNAVPYEQMFTNIDAQLQAGNPPDLFRVPYYTFGRYAGKDQLLDLSSHLPSGFSDRFTPQAWAAVQNGGKPHGVPHHTDTSVIYTNTKLLQAAGVTDLPTSIGSAWTWTQLQSAAQKLRSSLTSKQYPFAYNWQGNGVTRWLSLLFQADGRFLASDGKTPAIDSTAGAAALDFSKSWFTSKFVPANDTVTSTTYAADDWYSQSVAMVWGGAFMIPDAVSSAKFDWSVTLPPKKVRSGGDFGGNALVATKATKQPALAAAFLEYVTGQSEQKSFCETASLLPTRADLVKSGITFSQRGELSPVFVGQAGAVQAQDSGQVASPDMSAIIAVLKQQLDAAFTGGQSTAATLSNMSKGIASATAT